MVDLYLAVERSLSPLPSLCILDWGLLFWCKAAAIAVHAHVKEYVNEKHSISLRMKREWQTNQSDFSFDPSEFQGGSSR